jgi:hypothetical protein
VPSGSGANHRYQSSEPLSPNAHRIINGNSRWHISSSCPAALSLITTSAVASRNAAAHRAALSGRKALACRPQGTCAAIDLALRQAAVPPGEAEKIAPSENSLWERSVPDDLHLETGDCILLPSGRPFHLASDLGAPPVDLASGSDDSGPWLYSMDLNHRIPHQLTSAPDQYTSLAASADGRHLVVTRTIPKATVWHLRVDHAAGTLSLPDRISLTTSTGFSPRYGPDYLLYVSSTGANESVWKPGKGAAVQLWIGGGSALPRGSGHRPDGHSIAFSVRQRGRTLLYVTQADGTGARMVSDSLALEGAVAWSPDGQSITSAVEVNGVPQLFRIAVNGGPNVHLVHDYSVDPSWAPDGHLLVYSGPDIGTTFAVKAATADGIPYSRLNLTLTRGARRVKFLPGNRQLVFLRGDLQHRDLWTMDLDTGTEQQLTKLAPDFDVRDFDISADGREIVLQRFEEHSDVVLMDLIR